MRSPILKKQRFVARAIYSIGEHQLRLPYATPLNFLRIDPFAGRADEDELFRTHSKF
jgi:hypothetical protein